MAFEVEKDMEDVPEDVQLAFVLGKAYRNGYDKCKMDVLLMVKRCYSSGNMDELLFSTLREQIGELNG